MSPPVQRNPRVVQRAMADGEILLHLDTGLYHGLNETGSAVWQLIDGTRDETEIASAARDEAVDAPIELEADVRGFLSALRSRDLIR